MQIDLSGTGNDTITVRISYAIKMWLKAEARRKKTNMSAIVVTAINEYMKSQSGVQPDLFQPTMSSDKYIKLDYLLQFEKAYRTIFVSRKVKTESDLEVALKKHMEYLNNNPTALTDKDIYTVMNVMLRGLYGLDFANEMSRRYSIVKK